jgi:iron complex outermembrane receptor protein
MVKQLHAKLLLLLSVLIFSSMTGFAQTGDVTGTVTDASDQQPIPGATVVVKGTTTGTVTDMDGKYTINVGTDAILEFSYMGYESQEIKVQPNTTVNISLSQKSTEMDEFVVIGYGLQKKDDATGSVSVVDSKDFNRGAVTSPSDLITGRIAGVQVTSSGGAPGSGSVIRIRGGSSLRATNDPLVVIDGVPVSNDGIAGTRNPLNSINPNDIETFTVLKDASATAIYGSRASNGVILITTKKGRTDQPLTLDYKGVFSFNTLPNKVGVLGADEYRAMINDRFDGNNNVTSLLGTHNTDWQDEIYNSSFGQDHYLSISGGVKALPYRVSIGYSNQDGILKTDNMQRTTLDASLNPSFFDNHLTVDFNIRGSFVKNRFADRGAIGAAVQFDPTKPVNSDSTYTVHFNNDSGQPDSLHTDYGGYYAWTQANGAPVALATANPLALLNLRDDRSDVNRLMTNMKVDYKFHFLPELKATLNIGYDHSNGSGNVVVPEYAAFSFDPVHGGGVKNYYEQESKNELLDFYLDYNKYFDGIQSQISVMGGYSWQHFWRTNYSENGNYNKTWNLDTINDATELYLVSFFGRFNYTFKDKYLLTFTLRDDGTSRFSPDTRWGLFPSVALAWKINNEPWMAGAGSLSQLKLRAGYGVTGQQDIGLGNYPYLPRYTSGQVNAQYQMGNQFYTTLRPEGYDSKIKWEETTTWNVGLDYGFKQDKYFGTLDFYFKQTKDLLNFIPVPAGSNLTNYIVTNVGDMENRGVEFSFNARAIAKKDLTWLIGFNTTYNINEITKLTASSDTSYLGVATGGISGGVGNTVQMNSVGYAANSFFVYEQVYGTDGKPIEGMYVDRNGDGQITDDDRYHYKDPAAKFFFGINSSLQYKNWEFSFAGRANFGNYVYNNVSSENGNYERLYRPEGPYLSNVTSDVNEAGFQTPQYLSDYYIQDAAFFRMDNMGVSYLLEDLLTVKERLDIRLSFTVTNVFVITNYEGLDPEIYQGIDNNLYPRPRVYVLGVNIIF